MMDMAELFSKHQPEPEPITYKEFLEGVLRMIELQRETLERYKGLENTKPYEQTLEDVSNNLDELERVLRVGIAERDISILYFDKRGIPAVLPVSPERREELLSKQRALKRIYV